MAVKIQQLQADDLLNKTGPLLQCIPNHRRFPNPILRCTGKFALTRMPLDSTFNSKFDVHKCSVLQGYMFLYIEHVVCYSTGTPSLSIVARNLLVQKLFSVGPQACSLHFAREESQLCNQLLRIRL